MSDRREPLAYRPCVGVMLLNRDGRAFVGERIDTRGTDWWQMPQGGVDKGEDLDEAAYRELAEETGVTRDLVRLRARTHEPVRYDLPAELIGTLWGGKYCGQEQYWYLLDFLGEDADIDLEAHDPPEFCAWKWVDPGQLPELIIPFKREVYRAILDEFAPLIRR